MHDLALSLLAYLAPLLALAGLWILAQLALLLASKLQEGKAKHALTLFGSAVTKGVAMTEQTLVRQLKAAKDPSSPGGVSLTPDEVAQVKAACRAEVKEQLGPSLSWIARVLGWQARVDATLDAWIEAEVDLRKGNP